MQYFLNSFLQNFHYEMLIVLASSLLSEELLALCCNKPLWKRILYYIGSYIISIAIGVAGYALYRTTADSNFFHTFIHYGLMMLVKYSVSILLVPIVLRLFAALTDKWMPNGVRVIIIVLSLFLLIGAPYIIPTQEQSEKTYDFNDMIYTRKFYDISNFRERTNNGYVKIQEPETEGTKENTRTAPTKEIDQMNFHEAIEAMLYFDKLPDLEMARACNDRAYYLFSNGQANDDPSDIGQMWWYKGSYEDNGEWFYNAGLVYEEAGNHFNAAVSFGPAYTRGFCDADKPLYHYYQAATDGDKPDSAIDFLFEVYNRESERTPYVDQFVTLFPDNLRVQVLNITNHVDDMDADDLQLIESFSSEERYKNCPKLIILKNYYNLKNGMPFLIDTERLEEIDKDYFDPEDAINASWLLYLKGDYQKAYDFLLDTLPEDTAWSSYFEYNIVSSAIFLQDEKVVDEYNAKWFYADLNDGANDFVSFYNSDNVLKYEILKAYLGNKLGYKSSSDEINEAYAEEEYKQVIGLCDSSIERGHVTKSILLMKADAQKKLAEKNEGEERIRWLTEAEETLIQIRDNLSGDYREVLIELKGLYLIMPNREVELQMTDEAIRSIYTEPRESTLSE